ncbi:GIY-YIG nuclease family protein [Staphylococcus succinus]|uniref:GIY-YIG nuclease family protein n=1 Tax=Staphylococcus succinus TaxID=61015 RepID=UPI003F5C4AB5
MIKSFYYELLIFNIIKKHFIINKKLKYFTFDVHAMIFSEDAPKLENTLHRHFRHREINKVNHRKEFFKVNIDEIEDVVMDTHNNTAEFTKIPLVEQYWEIQNIN